MAPIHCKPERIETFRELDFCLQNFIQARVPEEDHFQCRHIELITSRKGKMLVALHCPFVE